MIRRYRLDFSGFRAQPEPPRSYIRDQFLKISSKNIHVPRTDRLQAALFLALFLWSAPAWAATLAQSGPGRVSLIEVYSSEGCSSCPPAESWVSGLTASGSLWKDFVPVVFHVDYWDGLGWKDRFSDNRFTQRQRAYSDQWRSNSIYTPGFVLNGYEWRDWYGRPAPPRGIYMDAGRLSVDDLGDGRFKVRYEPTSKTPVSLKVHAALLGFDMTVEVKAGENAGRSLKHDFAVLAYTEESMKEANGAFEKEFQLDLPAKAPSKTGIAVWVSAEASPAPIQAAGAYL